MALQLNSSGNSQVQTPASPPSDPWTDQTTRRILFDSETAPPPTPPMNLSKTTAATRPPPPPRPAEITAEITDVKNFVKSQIADLNEQVNALTLQMATLVALMANQARSAPAPPPPHSAPTDSKRAKNSAETAPDPDPADPDPAPADPADPDPAPADPAASAVANHRAARPTTNAFSIHRPSCVMLSAHKFIKTDKPMWKACQGMKPPPVNPSTALAAFAKIKPSILKHIHSIKSPGTETQIALETFLSEVSAVMNSPGEHTLAAMLTEALTTGDKTADSATQNLLRLAVNCGTPEKINQEAQHITATGRYNRALAALTDVTATPAYRDFDPETDRGKHLWSEILHLMLAFWEKPKSAQADQAALEQAYRNMNCADHQDIGAYITSEAEQHLKLRSCNIKLSDLERIRVILTGCSTQVRTAYQAFKQRKTEDRQWSHLRDCDVNTFAQDLESVADAIQQQQQQQPPDRAAKTCNTTITKQHRPDTSAHPPESTDDRPCWDHQYLQQGCPRGDNCPWKHVGESGAKRLRFATEDGTCRRFITGNCDRGDQCKFDHLDPPDERPAKKPSTAAPPAKRTCYDFANGSCKRGDQCNFVHLSAPAAHHASPGPDTDTEEDEYERY